MCDRRLIFQRPGADADADVANGSGFENEKIGREIAPEESDIGGEGDAGFVYAAGAEVVDGDLVADANAVNAVEDIADAGDGFCFPERADGLAEKDDGFGEIERGF